MVGRDLPPRESARSAVARRGCPCCDSTAWPAPCFEACRSRLRAGESSGCSVSSDRAAASCWRRWSACTRRARPRSTVCGRAHAFDRRARRRAPGSCSCPEDRQRQGLLLQSVGPAQPGPAARRRRRRAGRDARGERRMRRGAAAALAHQGRRPLTRLPDTLSGGNQQKVVVAQVARHARRACCCSTSRRRAWTWARSTRSTAWSARRRRAVRRAWWCRATCRRCSRLADRIVVMREGRVQGELTRRAADRRER